MFAQVVVALPLPPLTYRVPDGLQVSVGDPVRVRVRNKNHDGIVIGISSERPNEGNFEIKELQQISEDFPALNEEILKMLRWSSDYYHYPMGEVLRAFLPPNPAPPKETRFRLTAEGKKLFSRENLPKGKIQLGLIEKMLSSEALEVQRSERAAILRMKERGWVESFQIPMSAAPSTSTPSAERPSLTDKQGEAVDKIITSLERKSFETFLLQGVTGSGKTEVYLRAAEHSLRMGRSVLVIVPEISLTPQLVSRFRSRLGESIAVLHSNLADGERSRQWHLLNRGVLKVCIGARSAALAPIRDAGLIVVDEEHDSALKQEDHLKYNGRDLVIVRGKNSNSTVILGSATPSLESFHNCASGRYRHLILTDRPGGKPLPSVQIVDRSRDKEEGSISRPLRNAINQALDNKGQVMLLLNRRGFSSFLICTDCGFVPECPNCSVTLTNYRGVGQIKCHYCSYSVAAPQSCDKCGKINFKPGTLGTESLEEEVAHLFPNAKIIRIDRESMERKGALEKALEQIASKQVDIVIGTQMIAKGHDFPNISLVGVVNADSSFHLPDFRAGEKSFQLFTQMAGRAGRGDMPGNVILQTYNPKHPSIIYATHHDFRGFAEEELRFRHEFSYPPFSRMARLLISGGSSEEAEAAANKLFQLLDRARVQPSVDIIGPAPAVLSRIQNRFRWNILLKSKDARPLHTLIDLAQSQTEKVLSKRIMLQVDVDPISLM